MPPWMLECEARRPAFFFDKYVQPFRDKGQKVFVIISDALRYEAGVDFAERLRSANRWTAEVDALFGSSHSRSGMASLLPGRQRAVDAANATVTVDGRSASGTDNRAAILGGACNGKATALTAEAFLELNTKTDGRELMRDHEVIYIFHNHIDKVGESTEARTFEAVEETFTELEQIIRRVANINGTNMLLTADHGFLFQQDDVRERDMTALPSAVGWTYRNRRFALGTGIASSTEVKVFASAELGVSGNWSAAFPLSLGRFPLQGSGKRFVHGGISLQEVVIPVVRIHKARADDTGRVEVEVVRVPAKITTGQLAIALYQDRPAIGKVLPRTLRVGLFAKDGTSLSEVKTQSFDSKEPRLVSARPWSWCYRPPRTISTTARWSCAWRRPCKAPPRTSSTRHTASGSRSPLRATSMTTEAQPADAQTPAIPVQSQVSALDKKLLLHFPGLVVRKDLSNGLKQNAVVPTYVLEYLLGQHCATDDSEVIEAGLQSVQRILAKHYVHRNQAELVKSTIKEKGRHKVIDKLTVELNEKGGFYEAEFSNLGLKKVPLSDDFVRRFPKLLVGGIWCIVDVSYEVAEDQKAARGRSTRSSPSRSPVSTTKSS